MKELLTRKSSLTTATPARSTCTRVPGVIRSPNSRTGLKLAGQEKFLDIESVADYLIEVPIKKV